MDKIPTIGGARGIFEIFVPGAFLLINLLVVFYFSPLVCKLQNLSFPHFIESIWFNVIVFIAFGYLIGVLLRLVKAETTDRLSAKFIKITYKIARGPKTDVNLFANDYFPYTAWIGVVCQNHFPQRAINFYNNYWQGRNSKQFLNFCKILVMDIDKTSAGEIYAAEALSRYVSGMFNALVFSFLLLCVDVIFPFPSENRFILITILIIYLVAIFIILNSFRFLRIKEVETIFAACYKNKGTLKKLLS